MNASVSQRIVKTRRDYNTWVANETLEDYALRFAPRSFRKWSEFRVANTALGAVSFLALEAIGGTMVLNFGFVNAVSAIVAVSLLIFLTGLPISYHAARHGVDMDLLTRGAGFGYIGSTMTSLIYASFTFIFFALEAAIMALALELAFGIPVAAGYVICSLVVIPLVTHGVTWISRLQSWTQPLWLTLLVLPYVFILYRDPAAFRHFSTFIGFSEGGESFSWLLFGAASAVSFSLVAQIGEQVDFLRFLPEKTAANRRRWWIAMLAAGPGWILPGMLKQLGGAFLAFLALQHEIPPDRAVEPTQMYLVAFRYVFTSPAVALGITALFVILSQVKINVTNAYAGSLAWSNFFSRLTHNHPGRVVWLLFNVLIALLLMELGVFKALQNVLGFYSNVAVAWVGTLVADLVINKPLGLSPKTIEFKRAYLHDVNPVGVGSMLIASGVSIAAFSGAFGTGAQAFAPYIALACAFVCTPAIALLTRGRYYIARRETHQFTAGQVHRCSICENDFEPEDMAWCPAYAAPICSLCCSLDARCGDRCKPSGRLPDQVGRVVERWLPTGLSVALQGRIAHYLLVLALMAVALGTILLLLYFQEATGLEAMFGSAEPLRPMFLRVFALLLLIAAVISWWVVLASESRRVALDESERQTGLLMREIEAHQGTHEKLQQAKEAAESANNAKSRFVTGMSHELRTPLNSILGYAQILQRDDAVPPHRRDAIAVIRRSGEHLLGLIDGLLNIAKIEAGKLRLERREVRFPELLEQMVKMFEPQAADKAIGFSFDVRGRLPRAVYADEDRVRQILINLLANAVKFTDTGEVRLRVAYRREIAQIDVIDTGIGIASEDIERIFLPFERAWRAPGNRSGTGLGLTITQLLTEIMGGEIAVTSVPGHGSTFSVRLYLPEVAAPTMLALPEADVTGYLGPRRRLLLVDDQGSQRQLLSNLLQPLGFDIAEASGGVECLRAVALQRPDAVLLDVAMPDMDGWQVCKLLRRDGLADTPVIMVSANAFENDPERLADAGCNDFVVKPVFLSELLGKLATHLRLEWTFREPDRPAPVDAWTTPAGGAGTDALTPAPPSHVPDAATLEALRELGSIGYVKGILERLEQIDRTDPASAPVTAELRGMVRRFRLDEFTRRIEELATHGS